MYAAIQEDAKRLGYERVLCHNDTYAPNYLCSDTQEVYLIDWEYAGLIMQQMILDVFYADMIGQISR